MFYLHFYEMGIRAQRNNTADDYFPYYPLYSGPTAATAGFDDSKSGVLKNDTLLSEPLTPIQKSGMLSKTTYLCLIKKKKIRSAVICFI